MSNYETFTFTAGTAQEMLYDGFLLVKVKMTCSNSGSYTDVLVNNATIATASSSGKYQFVTETLTVSFKKGDNINITTYNLSSISADVAYYKKRDYSNR